MLLKSAPFISICILLLSAGCAVNPITGGDELMFSGDYEQDIALGRQYAPEVEKQLKGKIDDIVIQNYMDSVGRKIVTVSHNPNFDFHFTAVNDKSINALALPGGHIFITKGMLLKLKSEAQLAGILAHETVHVVARDTANMMSREIGLNVLLVAVMSQTSSEGAQTVAALAGQIISLKYSRDDEKTADLGGLDYMVRAGYNPNGIVGTMQMLEKEDTIRPVEFLSTHPSPENRVDYIRARIQSRYADKIEGSKIGQDDYQRLVLDRLKDLPDSPQKP
ncbi:MAG: M48 family metalloprotease [Sedimentisphaerales bacterium]|nr:M48 family metalloprotease [Sedimentisphaerales bacterium]